MSDKCREIAQNLEYLEKLMLNNDGSSTIINNIQKILEKVNLNMK